MLGVCNYEYVGEHVMNMKDVLCLYIDVTQNTGDTLRKRALRLLLNMIKCIFVNEKLTYFAPKFS